MLRTLTAVRCPDPDPLLPKPSHSTVSLRHDLNTNLHKTPAINSDGNYLANRHPLINQV